MATQNKHNLITVHRAEIAANVKTALAEDIGSGDITAALVPANAIASAKIILHEQAVLAGRAWVDEVFHQLEPSITIEWNAQDGETVMANKNLCQINGKARALLTGERAAINFLQTLSGTASTVARFANLIKHTQTKILDTRKTIPGLRIAQKYAVICGGGNNHRLGLYDAFLIKENHIMTAGGITEAMALAMTLTQNQTLPIEIEVESLTELKEAIATKPDRILLDNFSIVDLKKAVAIANGQVKLEASGNIDQNNIVAIADTGVDYLSIGALTKHIRAIELSMRIDY